MSPRTGRPTENPKNKRESFRLSEEDVNKIDFCVEKTKLSKTDVVRKGIDMVYNEIRATDALEK